MASCCHVNRIERQRLKCPPHGGPSTPLPYPSLPLLMFLLQTERNDARRHVDSPSRRSAWRHNARLKTGAIYCCGFVESCRGAGENPGGMWVCALVVVVVAGVGSGVDYTAHRKEGAGSLEWSERAGLPGDPDNDALDFPVQE